MLFNTIDFAIFLAVVLLLFYSSPKSWRPRILLLASYVFYMFWNPAYLPLLLGLTAVDFFAAIWIEQSATPRTRQLALYASLAANLAFLMFFKYTNFLIDNLGWLITTSPARYHLSLIIPLGISFHTFQSISYVVDVYRSEQKAIRNPLDYALFIAFFPQLVAGPIVRAREFFPDLFHWRAPTADEVSDGVGQILTGLVKKIVLADQFAIVADSYFGTAIIPGTLTAWSGVIAFAMQIYFDFSGYTDIAIGCAKLFGFHFPVNFRQPYLSASITEFWRCWHISLSTWLRNYLYIPLGGNRHGDAQTYRNLLLTMLIGGLWHGASWNFVIWGAWHGVLLAVERVGGITKGSIFRTPATFAAVCIGWVFFRAKTLPASLSILSQMFTWHSGPNLLANRHLVFIAVTLALAILERKRKTVTNLWLAPVWIRAVAIALVLLSIEIFGVTDRSIPFVYFQF